MKRYPYCEEESSEQNEAGICPDYETNEDMEEEDPGWLEKAAKNVIAWLEDGADEVRVWVNEHKRRRSNSREIAEEAIRSAMLWSGNAGLVAGLGDFLGPWGFGAGTVADIAYAAKLSVQMSQRIYCSYGYDISNDEIRIRIVASIGGGSAGIGKIAGAGTTRVGKRILEKYLRGALLRAIKSFLRKLGLVFTRKALVAWLPVIGSGVNLIVNRSLMESLGRSILRDIDELSTSSMKPNGRKEKSGGGEWQ